jgi:hypothetical protein
MRGVGAHDRTLHRRHRPRKRTIQCSAALLGGTSAHFVHGNGGDDTIGFLGDNTRAIFGRSYAAEPDALIEQLKGDGAIAVADTLLLTVPNQFDRRGGPTWRVRTASPRVARKIEVRRR